MDQPITVEAIDETLPFEGINFQDDARMWQFWAEALLSTQPVLPILRAYLRVRSTNNAAN